MGTCGQRGPSDGGLGAQVMLAEALKISKELSKELLVPLEFVTQGTAYA